MSDDIVERLRSLSILDGWLPMMEEAAVEIDRQRKVISAMIEDCQYLKDKQIEAADEIEKLRAALKPCGNFLFNCLHRGEIREMTNDLIARLRDDDPATWPPCDEAADALEAKDARIAELKAALRPFADVDVSDCADGHVCYFWGFGENAGKVSAAEVRAAHAAYLGEKG